MGGVVRIQRSEADCATVLNGSCAAVPSSLPHLPTRCSLEATPAKKASALAKFLAGTTRRDADTLAQCPLPHALLTQPANQQQAAAHLSLRRQLKNSGRAYAYARVSRLRLRLTTDQDNCRSYNSFFREKEGA